MWHGSPSTTQYVAQAGGGHTDGQCQTPPAGRADRRVGATEAIVPVARAVRVVGRYRFVGDPCSRVAILISRPTRYSASSRVVPICTNCCMRPITASLSLCYLLRAFSGYGVKIVHSNLPS